jgi:hypothetical protein
MAFDHSATSIHRAELDREIEIIRAERSLAADPAGSGLVPRVRRSAGRALIAAGEALSGRDDAPLRARGI